MDGPSLHDALLRQLVRLSGAGDIRFRLLEDGAHQRHGQDWRYAAYLAQGASAPAADVISVSTNGTEMQFQGVLIYKPADEPF